MEKEKNWFEKLSSTKIMILKDVQLFFEICLQPNLGFHFIGLSSIAHFLVAGPERLK